MGQSMNGSWVSPLDPLPAVTYWSMIKYVDHVLFCERKTG